MRALIVVVLVLVAWQLYADLGKRGRVPAAVAHGDRDGAVQGPRLLLDNLWVTGVEIVLGILSRPSPGSAARWRSTSRARCARPLYPLLVASQRSRS